MTTEADLRARIAELESERDEARAQIAKVLDPGYLAEKLDAIGAVDIRRALAAEAALAEAVGVLTRIASCASHHPDDVVAIARAFIAKHGGKAVCVRIGE